MFAARLVGENCPTREDKTHLLCRTRDRPAHLGSPSAAPDGGERRRPLLTRQNRKGNIEPSSPKFCLPQHRQYTNSPLLRSALIPPLSWIVRRQRHFMYRSEELRTYG